MSDVCADGHLWYLRTDGSVYCARCYQPLPVERMLAAYLLLNHKDRRHR